MVQAANCNAGHNLIHVGTDPVQYWYDSAEKVTSVNSKDLLRLVIFSGCPFGIKHAACAQQQRASAGPLNREWLAQALIHMQNCVLLRCKDRLMLSQTAPALQPWYVLPAMLTAHAFEKVRFSPFRLVRNCQIHAATFGMTPWVCLCSLRWCQGICM